MNVEDVKIAVETLAGISNSNIGGFILSWALMIIMAILLWILQGRRESDRKAEIQGLKAGLQRCQEKEAECEESKQRLAMGLMLAINGRFDEAREMIDKMLPHRRSADRQPNASIADGNATGVLQ